MAIKNLSFGQLACIARNERWALEIITCKRPSTQTQRETAIRFLKDRRADNVSIKRIN